MSSSGYYWFLVGEAAAVLAHFGPVTLALLALYVWAMARTLVKPGARRVFVITSGVAPAAIPALMLLVGVAFIMPGRTAWEAGVAEPVPWVIGQNEDLAIRLLQGLVLLHLVVVSVLAWLCRSGWLAAVASGLWWGWVAACAGFAAVESVTGNWL